MSRSNNNFGDLAGIFRRLQAAQKLGPLQKGAIDAQKQTRADIERSFAEQQTGFEQNVSNAFKQESGKQRSALAARGISPETLALLGDLGSGRESSLVLGGLTDQLTTGRLDALTGISKNLANIFTGATDQGSRLLSSLLGGFGQLGPRRGSLTGNFVKQAGSNSPFAGSGFRARV